MAYVLEYTSRYYQRRAAIRRGTTVAVLSIVLVSALASFLCYQLSRKPTYDDIVNHGYEIVRGNQRVKVESYQMLANKAFSIREKWSRLAAFQTQAMPYLRTLWAPVPVTNIVRSVSGRLEDGGRIPLLSPEGFCIRFVDGKSDWTGLDAEIVQGIVVDVNWKTSKDHYAEDRASACQAISNFFAEACGELPALSNVVVRSVSFPTDQVGGLSVMASYSFPSVRRMPYSKKLDKVVGDLNEFHDLLVEKTKIDVSGGNQVGAVSILKEVFNGSLGGSKTRSSVAEEAKFARSMDPAAWLYQNKSAYLSEPDNANKKALVDAWVSKTKSRAPWKRGFARKLMNDEHFYNPESLQEFMNKMPSTNQVDNVYAALVSKCDGLTNSIENIRMLAFDESKTSPESIHDTRNLLAEPDAAVVMPTNCILSVADGGRMTVRHPKLDREYEGDCILLPVPDAVSRTNRYAFADWSYVYSSTNSVSTLRDLCDGLEGFVGEGLGYQPGRVEAKMSGNGRLTRVEVSGILPLRLDWEGK